eukprot:gene4744-113_t
MKGLPLTMRSRRARARQARGEGLPRLDSVAVRALRAQGAVPFAKTNMSQLGDTWGGGNPAYGDTLN